MLTEKSQVPATGASYPTARDLSEALHEKRGLVRYRYRNQLNPRLQALLETNDILSTVYRRTYAYLRSNPLREESKGALWGVINRVTERAAIELARRQGVRTRAESGWVDHAVSRSAPRPSHDHALLERVEDPIDQEIVRLRTSGLTHTQIASSLGIDPAVVRKRWSRIRRRLMEELERTESDVA